MNIGVHISLLILVFLFSSDEYPGVKLLDDIVVLYLAFWGTAILFSIVDEAVYIHADNAWGFSFPHILTDTFIFFYNSHSVWASISLWFCFAFSDG